MRLSRFLVLFFTLAVAGMTSEAIGQEHDHGGHASSGGTDSTKPAPPTVFLDKSPRIVEYQLKRLDNQRLLLVERKTEDAKYIPVYQAILSRVGMSPQYQEEALDALVKLQKTDAVSILMATIGKLDAEDRDQARTAEQLAGILFKQGSSRLRDNTEVLVRSTDEGHALLRSIAYAALVTADQSEEAISRLERSVDDQVAFLNGVAMIPDATKRSSLRDQVVGLLQSSSNEQVRRAAVHGLGYIRDDAKATFELLAPLFDDASLRDETVRTLLKIPPSQRDSETESRLAKSLVTYAVETPAEDRTNAAFVDAMQLADQLLAKIPSSEAKAYRQRLDAITVRLVRIKTVKEEMRYDVPFFAVEAGKPVQIVLENHDLMPHNLVVTIPGALKEVAQLGLDAGPGGGSRGLPYVPDSEKVLHATELVPADQQTRLTFDAPSVPGEYPYVCTFPQHWYRMYGVMVVVDDLDAWLKNPVEPANPIGSNRSFVQAWSIEDFRDELVAGLKGRTPEIGKRLFAEASCAGCHKVQGEGGVIGPELTDLISRWKGDRLGVLREILDPSHKVDEKYVMQKILTADGQTVTGILVGEDDDHVTLVSSPDAKEPMVLARDDIDAMVPSSISMMPKALLDQYTKDEVFEILAYLESVDVEKE